MVRDELYITVPSLFRCPISMDVMRSPVSLCTGVTYDRSSIQVWLDSGHDTCPATMQILPSKDFIPNLTLRRLINLWAQSNGPPSPSPSSRSVSEQQLKSLVQKLENQSHGDERESEKLVDALCGIAEIARSGDENRRTLASFDGFASAIVGVLSREGARMEVLESAIRVLDSILLDNGVGEQIHSLISKRIHTFLAAILVVLRNGKLESKIAAARVLKSIATDEESKRAISENTDILDELLKFLGAESCQALHDAVLSSLIAIVVTRSTKAQLVGSGIVRHVTAILSNRRASKSVVEKAMKLLSVVSTCAEGRSAMSSDSGRPLAAVVERLMKVSRAATEDGVSVLWSACCVAGDRKARELVAGGNGVAKILLVMQSGCCEGHPPVRRMCGDLLRVLRAGASSAAAAAACDGVGLESYDSRTTHIMPR